MVLKIVRGASIIWATMGRQRLGAIDRVWRLRWKASGIDGMMGGAFEGFADEYHVKIF